MRTRTYIKTSRHSSLQMNVPNVSLKLQICTINNKRDILDQKIKVKKKGFKFSYPVIILQLKLHQ